MTDLKIEGTGLAWIDAASADEGLKRFEMTAYSGGPMKVSAYSHPVVVDLRGISGADKPVPIFRDHDPSRIVGHTDNITIGDDGMTVTGVISGSGADAKEIAASSKNGFPWQASIGANPEQVEYITKGKSAVINGQERNGPIYHVKAVDLREISFVPFGADNKTSATVTAQQKQGGNNMDFEKWLTAGGFDPATITDEQRVTLQEMHTEEVSAKAEEAKLKAEADVPEPEADAVDPVAEIRASTTAEVNRIAAIHKVASDSDLEAKAIAEGWSADKTELEILRAERPNVANVHVKPADTNAQALEAALCISAGMPEGRATEIYDEKTMDAATSRDIRGSGIQTLLYETLRAGGKAERPGRVDNSTITAAFEADAAIKASSNFSTVSLSGILSNVANKLMLESYRSVPSVIHSFCASTSVNDFKQVSSYRLTGSGVFQKVGPDGELKHGEVMESTYTNQVDTYGKMLSLTRQMIINDDLGAFAKIPKLIGRMSALSLEKAVFTLLLANTGSFFHSDNSNLVTGAGYVLALDGLTKGEQVFLDQTDDAGELVMIEPAILLVPSCLKVTATQLMNSLQLNETTTANKGKPTNNPHAGKFDVVTSSYLNSAAMTGYSTTAWYLFANPADIAAMEVAYLRGRTVPVIESTQTDFDTLGMKWRGYFDFGVAFQSPEAAVKLTGA